MSIKMNLIKTTYKAIYKKISYMTRFIGNLFFGISLPFKCAPVSAGVMVLGDFLRKMLPLVQIYALKEVINTMISLKAKSGMAAISFWIFIYILTLIIGKTNDSFEYVFFVNTYKKTDIYIDNLMIDKIVKSDLSFFDNSRLGDIVRIIKDNQNTISNLIYRSSDLITGVITLATIFGALFALSPVVAVLVIATSIPPMLATKKYYNFTWQFDQEHSNDYRVSSYLSDILRNREFSEEFRLYNNSGSMLKKYLKLWQSWYHEKNRLSIKYDIKLLLLFSLQMASIIVTFVYSIIKFIAGKIGVGDIQYYIGITEQVESNLATVSSVAVNLQVDSDKIRVIREFLAWTPSVIKSGERKAIEGAPEIEFRNVGFKYPGTGKWILRGLSFKINRGEKAALVGLNGAGKSTIVKLMLRFYDPDEGEILLNNINIKEYDVPSLRGIFGAVFQDYVTYALTIRDNITLSNYRVKDDDRLKEAVKFSALDQITDGLEKGLDTYVTKLFDPDGLELSGGQKQKLALSRAFYRKASFMILDEPAAALDPEAENELYLRFVRLWKDKGAVLISHRLSNTAICNHILFIENGKVVEEGTHDALIHKNGKYAELFNIQAKRYKRSAS